MSLVCLACYVAVCFVVFRVFSGFLYIVFAFVRFVCLLGYSVGVGAWNLFH